jgi:hypothetical protein
MTSAINRQSGISNSRPIEAIVRLIARFSRSPAQFLRECRFHDALRLASDVSRANDVRSR